MLVIQSRLQLVTNAAIIVYLYCHLVYQFYAVQDAYKKLFTEKCVPKGYKPLSLEQEVQRDCETC
jgi:hypothetical protein